MPFDPFRRFRPRSDLVLVLAEDSDASSPERGPPRVKNDRKSSERHMDNPSKRQPKSGVASVAHHTDPVDALQPTAKPTLIRRVTSKLNIIAIPARSGNNGLRSRPSTRTLFGDTGPPTQGPRPRNPAVPVSPTLPNDVVSRQHREAALRERGLLPPRKDLSQQEREADRRLGSIPSPASLTFDGATEAERLKVNWLASNRTSESSDSDSGPPAPPFLQRTRSPSSPVSLDTDAVRRSSESKTDLPCAGRPSFCSSVTSMPPLSTSSYLEVLHEEPSEQGPITPPPPLPRAILPVIVSSSFDSPPSPILVESPVSCTFSSHCPGSTFESHSQSSHRSHPPVPERASIRSAGSRRRTSDSGDRPRRVVGSSLSKFGTHSLTNLRRSVAGSLGAPSSSNLSTADHSVSSQAQRTAIDPTMHSLGSILRETKDIKDAESRRLSELAFLD